MTRIGVLALQGDFREHLQAFAELGVEARAVRLPRDLDGLDGVVLPGGESTVMGKLMVTYELVEPLRALIASGVPAWGTCAGLILLSRETDNALAGQPLLAAMDIRTRRNAFGPQRASFEADITVPALGEPPYHAVFIRAPLVESVGAGVETLARLDAPVAPAPANGEPALAEPIVGEPIVAVRQGRLLGTAFHPEVTGDRRFHRYFLAMAA